jgi:hypothetical protein
MGVGLGCVRRVQCDRVVPLLILDINGLAPVSPRGDMVERSGKLDPQGSRHVQTLPPWDARTKT